MMRILLGAFILFAVIFFIVRLAGSGGDDNAVVESETTTVEEAFVLSEQNNGNSSVRFTIVGKTNAAEDHREFRFTISQRQRRVDIIKGYDGQVLETMQLSNTPNAYQEFLYALEAEGYTTMKSEERLTVTDPRGQCSDGKMYEYKAFVNGELESDLWSVSCSSRKGTFGGDRNDIVRLFERQFPEYKDFTRGVRL